MWTLYEPKNRYEDAKTLADFFGRRFFGGKNKPAEHTTCKAVFFMVEEPSKADEERLDKAA